MLKNITFLDQYQKDCVSLLEETLDEANNGNVQSIALVVVMKDGFTTNMAGLNAADLYLGASKIQHDIMQVLTKPKILR